MCLEAAVPKFIVERRGFLGAVWIEERCGAELYDFKSDMVQWTRDGGGGWIFIL